LNLGIQINSALHGSKDECLEIDPVKQEKKTKPKGRKENKGNHQGRPNKEGAK
jgi:hypothetical protein